MFNNNDFLWKPSSAPNAINPGGVSVLFGKGKPRPSSVGIFDAKSGNLIENLTYSPGDELGYKFYSRKPGGAFGNVVVKANYGGAEDVYNIGAGGMRYQGNLGSSDLSSSPDTGGGNMVTGGGYAYPPGFAPVQVGQYGYAPAYLGGQYPSPVFVTFNPVNYQPINPAPYNFTDAIKYGTKYGEFARGELQKNFDVSKDIALDTLDTELGALKGFVPAASALKRTETSLDNVFNQAERTRQVDEALPGARADLNAQRDRATAFAEGRLPDSIEDKAFEVARRSEAADRANAGGFGVRSSVARKTSDLMSADARVNLSKYGDSLLQNNLKLKSDLLLAPTEYSNAGGQVNVNPSVSPSQLISSNFGQVNSYSTIPAPTALQSQTQQEQFVTNNANETNRFNATNTLQKDEFNSSNALQNSQYNAGVANSFNLGKFQYDVGYAGIVAGAAQTNANTQVAIDQQNLARQTFEDYLRQAQQAGQAGAISTAIGALLTSISTLASSLNNLFGGGSGTKKPTTGGSQGPELNPGAGGENPTSGPEFEPGGGNESAGSSSSGGSVDIDTSPPDTDGSFSTTNDDRPLDSGADTEDTFNRAPETSDSSSPVYDEDQNNIPDQNEKVLLRNFSQDTGIKTGTANAKVLKQVLKTGEAVQNGAGVYSQSSPSRIPMGVDTQGNPVFANKDLARSNDASAGQRLVKTVTDVLDPTGAFTDKDKGMLDQVAAVSGDLALVARLNELRQNGDTKGFVNALIQRFGQPVVNSITDNPRVQDGAGAAMSAYRLFATWDRLSPAQKGLGIAKLGLLAYRSATGENLFATQIIAPNGNIPGLNVGQALNLMGQGYNVYSLVKNWNQLNNIQKMTYGAATISNLAVTAQNMNLLGNGINGAAVGTAAIQQATSSGFIPAPSLGVGAMTGPAGSVPSGFVSAGTTAEGSQVIVPAANAPSVIPVAAGVINVGMGTKTIIDNWGTGGAKGRQAGLLGGSQIAGGLYLMGQSGFSSLAFASNPYLLAGVVATSVLVGSIQAGKSGDQLQRDAIRGGWQKLKLTDDKHQITLADGTKADVGIDGHGGQFEARHPELLQGNRKNTKLNAWDVDYTNDLDYTVNLGSSALNRLLFGNKDKAIDQEAGQLTNAMLKNIGHGKDMTPENFSKGMQNLRAAYAKVGISSKADAFQLANLAFAEHRINASDHASMLTTFDIMYNQDGYQKAQSLMKGRWNGIDALKTNPPEPSKPVNAENRGPGVSDGMPSGTPPGAAPPKQTAKGQYQFNSGVKTPASVMSSGQKPISVYQAGKNGKMSKVFMTKEQIAEINRKRYYKVGLNNQQFEGVT